jgi:hypothetical protein
LDEKGYGEYVVQMTSDVYDHPALGAEDLAGYEAYKCRRVLEEKHVEPLDTCEAPLGRWAQVRSRKACRLDVLR